MELEGRTAERMAGKDRSDARRDDEPESVLSDRDLLRRLAAVSLPVYPMAMVGRCVGLFSIALVGHLHGADALAAMGLANVITNITGYSWLWGLSAAISTFSSQSWGAKSYPAIGVTLQRAFLVLFCFADIPLVVLWLLAEDFLLALDQPPEVARLVGLYARIRVPGIFFTTVYTVVSRTLSSMGKMTINLNISLVTMITNIIFSWLLIPPFGFVGAPIALLLSDAVQAVGVCLLAWRDKDFRKCWPGFTRQAWGGWPAFLRISCPSLLLLACEWWTFDLQNFLAGLISPVALATQAVAPRVTDLQYSVGQSLSTGASTVIGNLLGEGRPASSRRVAGLAMILTLVLMTIQAVFFVALREQFARLFTADGEIVRNIIELLPLTLTFSFLDSHQCTLTGILIGAGKQDVAAPICLFCYWIIGVPLGVVLAFGHFGVMKQGLKGLWMGMVVGVILHTLLFGLVVARLQWPQVAEEVRKRLAEEQQCALETDGPRLDRSLVDGPSQS